MLEVGDGTFKAEYGRVGGHMSVEIYPMSKWESKYREKLSSRKGYVDKTHLFEEEIKTDEKTSKKKQTINEITNKIVAKLVNDLRGFAKISVQQNYIVSSEKVTQKMIDEAQVLVNEITSLIKMNNEVAPINKLLIELFQVIPRKMKNVNDYLFMGGPILDTKEELAEAQKLISKEQDTLDVMAGQVSTNSKLDIKNSKPNEKNILESMGLIIEEAPQSDIPIILDLMGQNKNQFVKAFIVNNLKTQKLFDKNILNAQNKTVDVFWHGSRNENWWSILDTGWKLRPSNAIINGKMFGHGIYWANKFQKSLGYTSYRGSYWARGSSDRAYLSLAAVHIGDQLKIKRHESWCYDLNWNNLRKRGNYDSLYALGGADLRNDEFIVYQEPQCTIKYLIEVK
jgi:poly [ADP-ribose] polymerase